jgi:hypothetical protein
MIGVARNQVLALASLRHGLPAVHARGVDKLPAEVTAPLEAALVGSLDQEGLEGALAAVVHALIEEIERADPELAARLAEPLAELARSGSPPRRSDSAPI